MVNPYCPPGCPISDREGEDDSPREPLLIEMSAAEVEMVLARLLESIKDDGYEED